MTITREAIGKPIWVIVLCALFSCFSQTAAAQAGTDPLLGLGFVICQQGVFGGEFTIPVNKLTSPDLEACQDSEGPSTFGHSFVELTGICEQGDQLPPVAANVQWANCQAPLIGESEGGFDAQLVIADVGLCGPSFDTVGQVLAQARVFNFLLGTLLSQGQEGFANCVLDFEAPTAPSISSC